VIDNPADFHRLDSRLRLQGVLTLQTALHVGAGKSSGEGTDIPVLRDADGYPFLPGASVKGVLRSTLEALIRSAENRSSGLWTCNPLIDKPGTHDVACGVYAKTESKASVDTTQHCAICKLFGSRIVSSHVRISDSMMLHRRGRPPIELRDGVAIDRDRKVVSGAQKYDFEVVSPGTQFNIEVFVENPKPWLMGLLTIGFDQIADGFSAVGGFSSRGLGRVTLQWGEVLRFTALQLLKGEEPEKLSGEHLSNEQKQWRDALAARVTQQERK
jgi:CRISPR-associated protein Csm3